jgi:hypothetical protein
MEAADAALRDVEALNMGAVAASLRACLGSWYLDRGQYEHALKHLAPAYRVARRLGMRSLYARAAGTLARLYEATNDPMAHEMDCEAATLRAECAEGWPLERTEAQNWRPGEWCDI